MYLSLTPVLITLRIHTSIPLPEDFWIGSCTVKDTVKDYVPVDTLIDTDKLLELLMFRSAMVHVLGTYVFLSRTISFSKYLICQHIVCNRLGV